MKITHSESVETSNFLRKTGKYHVLVNEFVENPPDQNDQPMLGAAKITCEVISGTDMSEKGKTFQTTFFSPDPESNDKGRFAQLKLTRLYIALGGSHTPGQESELNAEFAVGGQFVIEVGEREAKNKKIYFDIMGANIYHVDDPDIASVPKDLQFLEIIDPSRRLTAVNSQSLTNVTSSASAKPSGHAPITSAPVDATRGVDLSAI